MFKTRTQMLEDRKKSKIPHSTYNLDGAGGVSNKEYFFASKFDLNHDGKLDKEERQALMESLKKVS